MIRLTAKTETVQAKGSRMESWARRASWGVLWAFSESGAPFQAPLQAEILGQLVLMSEVPVSAPFLAIGGAIPRPGGPCTPHPHG